MLYGQAILTMADANGVRVLILIFLENALRQLVKITDAIAPNFVLILIFLENALRPILTMADANGVRMS